MHLLHQSCAAGREVVVAAINGRNEVAAKVIAARNQGGSRNCSQSIGEAYIRGQGDIGGAQPAVSQVLEVTVPAGAGSEGLRFVTIAVKVTGCPATTLHRSGVEE